MAKSSKPASSGEKLSDGSNSSQEERINDQINGDEDEEEELKGVARPAAASVEKTDDADEDASNGTDLEISKGEKDRLKEMQKLKKQKILEIMDAQNAVIDADLVHVSWKSSLSGSANFKCNT